MLPADIVYQGDRLAYILKSTITMLHMMWITIIYR